MFFGLLVGVLGKRPVNEKNLGKQPAKKKTLAGKDLGPGVWGLRSGVWGSESGVGVWGLGSGV